MYENSFTHLIKTAYILTDHQHFLVLRTCQILPIPVKSGDAMGLELLWIVRETDLIIYSIGTHRVFTRLLQVNNYAYIQAKDRNRKYQY